MGHLLYLSDAGSSIISLALIVSISATTLLLLPRQDKASLLFWIVPCVSLSLFEAASDNFLLSPSQFSLATFLALFAVSLTLSLRALSSLGRTVSWPLCLSICAVLSWVGALAPEIGESVGAEDLVLLCSLLAASCWPMATTRVFACMRSHPGRVLLFALILGYATAILMPGVDGNEPGSTFHQLEAALPFLGVVVGFAASTLALRHAFRDNARLMEAEHAARLEKEQAAQFLRALIDTFPAAVYVKDLQGRYRLVNKQAAQWYHRSEAEMIGCTDFDLLAPATAQALREHDDLVITTGQEHIKDWELRVAAATDPRSMRSHKFPLFNPDGKVLLVAGLAMDMTAIKEHERALEAARFKAEEANCAKSNFLSHMSHELRTPLNAIIGFSEIIHSGALGPVGNDLYREYAGDIRGAGQLLLTQVEDLLDIAQFDSDSADIVLEPLNLAVMIADCCHLLHGQAERKQIVLDVERVRTLPKVHGDMRATTQVLVNLIGGSIKSLPGGSVISIAGGRTESGGCYLLIEDNGPKQSSRDLQALLDPWTFRPATKAEDGRGGLGLLLARRLMEAQGGRLVIESSPKSGTRIACQFAIAPSEEPADLAFGS